MSSKLTSHGSDAFLMQTENDFISQTSAKFIFHVFHGGKLFFLEKQQHPFQFIKTPTSSSSSSSPPPPPPIQQFYWYFNTPPPHQRMENIDPQSNTPPPNNKILDLCHPPPPPNYSSSYYHVSHRLINKHTRFIFLCDFQFHSIKFRNQTLDGCWKKKCHCYISSHLTIGRR